MAVAKRQRKRKAHKKGTKEKFTDLSKNLSETNTPPSWLALLYIGQAQERGEKCIKRGSQDRLRPLLWGWPTLTSQGCTVHCLPNKTLSSNQPAALVGHFKALLWRDRTEAITHSLDISIPEEDISVYCLLSSTTQDMSTARKKQALLKFQFSLVTQSCPTLCDPMNCSMPGLPVHHQLPEFTQIHLHRVSDAIQPSHPLSSPSPPAPNPSQHQSLFQ